MNFRQLRYFSTVMELGTLSQASENLRVAVSALSHHIGNLEAEIGVPLFDRKPRGMSPTAAGYRLNEHARQILRLLDAAETDVREATEQVAGSVSIGLAYSVVKTIGVELAQQVLNRYPNIGFSFTESLSAATLVNLMASDVDLAAVYNPIDNPVLKTEPLLEERLVCIGTKETIGDTNEPIKFDELLKLPIILLRQGISTRAIIKDANLLNKLESRARLQMNSVQAIAGSLEKGLGCAVGTKLIVRDQLLNGALNFRPIVEPELSRTLYLCELAGRPPTFASEAVKNLTIELISDAVKQNIWEAKLL